MGLAFPLSLIALLSVAACSGSVAHLGDPAGGLQGAWQTWPLVPSGSGIDMSLATIGSNVVGRGRASELQRDLVSYCIFGSPYFSRPPMTTNSPSTCARAFKTHAPVIKPATTISEPK